MKSTRRIFALPIIGTALALIGFGIVIGVRPAGPGQGVRLTVMIETTEPSARELAHRVLKERLDLKGVGGRMTPAGDRIIVEVGSADEQVVGGIVSLIERPSAASHGGSAESTSPSTALDAAAAPPLKVTKRDAFSRATGFWPRVWPFFAIAGVLLVIAAALWLRAP